MLLYLAGRADGGPVRYALIDQTESPDRGVVPGVFARDRFHQVVNVDPRESETDRCTGQELASRFGFRLQSTGGPEAAVQTAGVKASADLRSDEIWHWALLALLGVLLVENFLANRTPA